jgi:hypothetical protein
MYIVMGGVGDYSGTACKKRTGVNCYAGRTYSSTPARDWIGNEASRVNSTRA